MFVKAASSHIFTSFPVSEKMPGSGDRGISRAKAGQRAKRGESMAKPNYQFQKRQKELEKKRKHEEKLQRKLDITSPQTTENPDRSLDAVEIPAEIKGA